MKLKLFFIKTNAGYDGYDPVLILAENKEEAEEIYRKCDFNDLAGIANNHTSQQLYGYQTKKEIKAIIGTAGAPIELKKGILWGQYNAG